MALPWLQTHTTIWHLFPPLWIRRSSVGMARHAPTNQYITSKLQENKQSRFRGGIGSDCWGVRGLEDDLAAVGSDEDAVAGVGDGATHHVIISVGTTLVGGHKGKT